MSLTDRDRAFLEDHHSAAMTTLRADGTAHVVRVGVALVDGMVWSSGTQTRVRTRHLRRDPRCTLFVFDPSWKWLSLETTVTILDGPEVPMQSVRLFQVMQGHMTPAPAPGKLLWNGQEKSEQEFQRIMVEERRLIYQFEPLRSYSLL